ncbi:MAG: YbaB/EbfC family nucleoid-associated protein [Candidatus Margulisbacteria bacterium]|nr:YbaB/EbfC family nucleoid-associated protein [Candidatus Margulisiibacteriota bacterium]MBU1021391.1 YbaB/EbfC family nucleoid-associated protein [Candidatus Margulisiibacteriota bacterium]MBU1729120.1 YbaB/EbfC family nucleoid-associated protein [Candidatus Margulisiibacteriota bacterium]MBU1954793.1 YbaB/EbfC family nucleoid-associated protein [Candidatus Margulisiibacteriota bacterium]
MVFGNIGKMGEMMKQAREMQKRLASIVIEKEEKGVKVKVSGDMEVLGIEIDPALLSSDANKLADALKKAVNAGVKEAKTAAARQLGGMGGGFGL